MIKTLLITPPFVHLNSPYPATGYLTRYLKAQGYPVEQYDLSIDLFRTIFTSQFIEKVFTAANSSSLQESSRQIYNLRNEYIRLTDTVIHYLRGKQYSLTRRIVRRDLLPEGPSFSRAEIEFENDTGIDRARFLCTLFIQDLSLFIRNEIDEDFSLTKYAERISLSPPSFKPVKERIAAKKNIIIDQMLELLDNKLLSIKPELCGFTVPFPGNLAMALICSSHCKTRYAIKTTLGGGYVNTELRSINDISFFDYADYLTLDDGERPMARLIDRLSGKSVSLKRTFFAHKGEVCFETSDEKEPSQTEIGFPLYDGIDFERYLDLIDTDNPVMRLWNEGTWNKMTIAHGCYWKKCAFCDTTLDYISRYKSITGEMLANRVEKLIAQTGNTGFHFVDEAAPPKVLMEFAIAVLRRRLSISWWTNIRFENYFTRDMCRLLSASGCIAVTGGLETASNRLLALMKKGISVQGAASTAKNFSDAGILVHAYLIYGFPTQSEQEIIDALETVKQMFEYGCIQSAYYHQYAMTAHSDTGKFPGKYRVVRHDPEFAGFALNDLRHTDPSANHARFSSGLAQAIFNYNRGTGFDLSVNDWFRFPTPRTSVKKNYIRKALEKTGTAHAASRILFLANGVCIEKNSLVVYDKNGLLAVKPDKTILNVCFDILEKCSVFGNSTYTINELKKAAANETAFLQIMSLLEQLNDSGLILFL